MAHLTFGLKELVRAWRLTWDFLTVLLVCMDGVILPFLLGWPELFPENGFVDNWYQAIKSKKRRHFQNDFHSRHVIFIHFLSFSLIFLFFSEVTPAFWVLDIVVSLTLALLSENRFRMLVSYACREP